MKKAKDLQNRDMLYRIVGDNIEEVMVLSTHKFENCEIRAIRYIDRKQNDGVTCYLTDDSHLSKCGAFCTDKKFLLQMVLDNLDLELNETKNSKLTQMESYDIAINSIIESRNKIITELNKDVK